MIHIVLVEPEIPQNTGNIARTCAATGSELHLVKPLGYSLEDKYLKRAGAGLLAAGQGACPRELGEVLAAYPDAPVLLCQHESAEKLCAGRLSEGCVSRLRPESRGPAGKPAGTVYDHCIRIPMIEGARSLNLSNSVAIVTYEALRQHNFEHLLDHGALTGRDEEPGAWMDYL